VRYDRLDLTRSPICRWFRISALLLFCSGWLTPASLLAQQPGGTPPQVSSPPQESTPTQGKDNDPFSGLVVPGAEGACPSPSTKEKILIGVGTLALAVVLFLLLVRLMERRNIQRDRSATMGRHVGFSLTIFLSAAGLAAIVYLVTGCVHREFILWLGFCLAVWIIHGIYTFIVVRGD
jgi:hypothetical protein